MVVDQLQRLTRREPVEVLLYPPVAFGRGKQAKIEHRHSTLLNISDYF